MSGEALLLDYMSAQVFDESLLAVMSAMMLMLVSVSG
jgi:hypothetical protein